MFIEIVYNQLNYLRLIECALRVHCMGYMNFWGHMGVYLPDSTQSAEEKVGLLAVIRLVVKFFTVQINNRLEC